MNRSGRPCMKAMRIAIMAAIVSCALAQDHSAPHSDPDRSSHRAKLIGAWHLVSITGPDGKPVSPAPLGMLIYTRDGHMSVQLMYPKTDTTLSNQYVQSGYEASFGGYDVDEARHIVTHHVQGSITRDLLIGKDLPRVYQFTTDGRLLIKSAVADEHWSVVWEHY
jgi:Lipocalin-like domain